MEANFLRLILIILGIGLVLGIYLWDRYKRENARVHAVRRDIELELGTLDKDADVEEEAFTVADSDDSVIDQELGKLDAIVREEASSEAEGDGEQIPLFFAFDEDAEKAEKARDKLPQKFIVINVASRTQPFAGDAIVLATRQLGLEAGAMDIYHRMGSGGGNKTLFSMASMVEPGTFPVKDMSAFATPGLCLFAQLPGPKDGVAVFDEMLSAAKHLAERLGGELQDESHSVLTRQALDHTREEIVEFQRQLRIARKTT